MGRGDIEATIPGNVRRRHRQLPKSRVCAFLLEIE
jgi:hypothetical protein